MKNAFNVFTLHRNADKTLFRDDDGCAYLKVQDHPLFVDGKTGEPKDFCNPTEVIQSIRDHNAPKQDVNNPAVMVAQSNPFKGEIVILNVIEF
jgi:hypothetical protein